MKLLRKIAPLAVGLLFIGASVAAADLSAWKVSFPGTDTAVVVGAGAAAQDTLGAVHIANAIGTVQGGTAPVAGAHLIEAPGDDFNYGEEFLDIEAEGLSDTDLPILLADGNYRESRGNNENEETYTQTLEFVAGTDTVVFDADENDAKETADTYLFIDKTIDAYTYTLEFDDAIDYDGALAVDTDEDFELSKIKILGREYTIVDANDDVAADGAVDELVLMAGAVKTSQWEYSKATYTLADKTYEVEVKIISDDDSTAILVINGEETDEMEEGDTYTLEDDTRVGVVDVVPNEGAEKSTGTSEGNDLVTFFLGAEKIDLINNDEVEINGEAVEDSNVFFDNNVPVANALTTIEITAQPEDDLYIGKDEAWTDPVLGRFKYTLQGLDKNTELIEGKVTTSDDGNIKLENNAGDEIEIPVVMDAVTDFVFPGDELVDDTWACTKQDGEVITPGAAGGGTASGGNLLIADTDQFVVDNSLGNTIDDAEFTALVVSIGGEARIITIDDVDNVTNTYDAADEYGNSWDDLTFGVAEALSGFTTITLTLDNAAGDDGCDVGTVGADDVKITATNINNFVGGGVGGAEPDFETSLAGEVGVEFDIAGGDGFVQVYLFNNDGESLVETAVPGTDILFNFEDDLPAAVGGDLIIDADPNANLNWVSKEEDSDYDMAIDNHDFVAGDVGPYWGAIFTYDDGADEPSSFVAEYPEEEVIVKAYVSEILTTIPELAAGGGTGAVTPVLDTDIDDVKDKNIVVMGGTAINRVAAEMLDVTFPVYGSDALWTNATKVDAAGKAIIKLMDSPYTTGKFAMLVAGWEGVDTERAAKALKEGTPALSGQSVLLNTATSTVTVVTA